MPSNIRDLAPHQQTLRQWLRQRDGDILTVVPRPAYGAVWSIVGRHTSAVAEQAAGDRLVDVGEVSPRRELRFRRHRSGLLVYRDGEDRPSGCFLDGTLWVRPDARRLGLGGELLLANTLSGGEMGAAYYAVNGLRSRLASHRLAVERALAEGGRVPDRVMEDYVEAGNGGVGLADPQWHGAIRQALASGAAVEHRIRPRPGR